MRPSISCALLALALTLPAAAAPDPKKPAQADDPAQIADRLLDRIDIEARLDKVPLKDVLNMLQDRTGLTILLDVKALWAATNPGQDQANFAQSLEDAAITVPAMKRVRVETVLRQITDQLDADYYIAPDHVRITTAVVKDTLTGNARPLPELYPNPAGDDGPQVERKEVVRNTPVVTITVRDTPAADALKEVAGRAGRTVVVSGAAAEKAKGPVTVSLTNVPFETAAAALAEAAGLRAFRTGNVVVIVTAERARRIEEPRAGGPVAESRLVTPELKR